MKNHQCKDCLGNDVFSFASVVKVKLLVGVSQCGMAVAELVGFPENFMAILL